MEFSCPLMKSICNGGEWIAGRMQRFSSVLSKFTWHMSRVPLLSLSTTLYFKILKSLLILHSVSIIFLILTFHAVKRKIFLQADFLLPIGNLASLLWGGCCSTVADGAITDLWNYIFRWLSCFFLLHFLLQVFLIMGEHMILNPWIQMWCCKRWLSILSMIFLHYITGCPQTSFENKVVWFSFLNSIFINIWPSC